MKKLLTYLFVFSFATSANAALIELAPQSASTAGSTISYNSVVTPTSTFSDALFTLNIGGDFDNNNASESVVVSIDGFSLGTVFDNITTNDSFDFANDDYLGNHNNMITMTGVATIAQADWATIIADGFINITFDLASGVGCCTAPFATTSGSIEFTSGTADIPEPASIAFLALGLIGMGFARKNKSL